LTNGQLGIGLGIPAYLAPSREKYQAISEIVPIYVTENNLVLTDCMPDHMMQRAWGFNPTLWRHGNFLSPSSFSYCLPR
jgi:hypothetical protein